MTQLYVKILSCVLLCPWTYQFPRTQIWREPVLAKILVNLLARTLFGSCGLEFFKVLQLAGSRKCPVGEPKQVLTGDCEFQFVYQPYLISSQWESVQCKGHQMIHLLTCQWSQRLNSCVLASITESSVNATNKHRTYKNYQNKVTQFSVKLQSLS